MHKSMILAFVVVMAVAATASAELITFLEDSLDNQEAVAKAANLPATDESRATLAALDEMMSRWKERDFVALFGPGGKLPEKLAMPVAQPRGLALPGQRYADEKANHDHTEAYAAGGIGYVQVYYGIDGERPVALIFHLRPDADFIKVGGEKGAAKKRLAWDHRRLQALRDWTADRWREVYKVEVDAAKESEQLSGDFSRDMKTKLAAWKETGRKNEWRLEEDPGAPGRGPQWSWYDQQGKLVRHAYSQMANKLPNVFIWVYPGTHDERRHEEGMGQGYLAWFRWCRPDGTNIRYEMREHVGAAMWRADTWVWYDGLGKEVRDERDTNGDGIPDRVSDRLDAKQDQPLAVAESWAVHPELIPAESRIGDDERAIPLREIPKRPRVIR